MNKFSKQLSWIYILAIVVAGCYYDDPPAIPNFPTGTVEGYRPIYADPSDSDIDFMAARPLQDPGKIYVVAQYLLINEKFQGIHIYDNSDPSHPIPLGFLRMIGNTEVAVRNNVLYADHLSDLIAIDISDWNNPRELSRTKQDFWSKKIPPGNDKYFECVDDTKGIVIGWKFTVLNNPKCFR